MKNKVAIITGAGRGIGFALALKLAEEGVKIIANDLDERALDQLVAKIKKHGSEVKTIIGDAGEISCVNQMVSTAIEHFGRVDFAIANAGITKFGNFFDFSESDFDELSKVNLKGSFFLAQKAAKVMIDQGIQGRILMMSSVTGFQYHKDLVAYGMTKAALKFLVKSLGVELADKGITVNALAPGATLTERTEGLSDNYSSLWESITPNGKIASVDNICQAALFFLHDETSHVTGQTLVIDGGWTSISPQP